MRTVSIDRLKPAYVLHVDTESASPLAIPSGLMFAHCKKIICNRKLLHIEIMSFQDYTHILALLGETKKLCSCELVHYLCKETRTIHLTHV